MLRLSHKWSTAKQWDCFSNNRWDEIWVLILSFMQQDLLTEVTQVSVACVAKIPWLRGYMRFQGEHSVAINIVPTMCPANILTSCPQAIMSSISYRYHAPCTHSYDMPPRPSLPPPLPSRPPSSSTPSSAFSSVSSFSSLFSFLSFLHSSPSAHYSSARVILS